MDLIIGGAYQGKKHFAFEQFGIEESALIDGRVCEYEDLKHAKGIHHFQDYIKRLLCGEREPMAYILEQVEMNQEAVILCNELGCGLVPMDAFDRRYREMVGRIQCEIAKRANSVYRVYCGIGVKIK